MFLIVVAVVLVVLVCGGCAYYQNAKKKKAVEVGLDADSLEFKGGSRDAGRSAGRRIWAS